MYITNQLVLSIILLDILTIWATVKMMCIIFR